MRVIIVDSDQRRAYEEAMRVKSMERTHRRWRNCSCNAAGKLKQPEKIGSARAAAAAEPWLPLLFLGDPPGGLPVLRERGRPGEVAVHGPNHLNSYSVVFLA